MLDTHVLITMLDNMDNLKSDGKNIYMEYGVANKKRTLNVTQLHIELGPAVCVNLPGFHAITRCDYNPALSKKGKKKPFQILKNNSDYQKALADIGMLYILGLQYEILATLEKFFCELYGYKNFTNINDALFQKFCSTYKSKNTNELLEKL